ncbi:MAG: hypothetical protein R3E01_27225 [Pirellulaceae bacterium]|nr:hypothetical protein [Planctomycetales bacterium]
MKANGKPTSRRPIEREYLATLNAAVPLDVWQAICKRAADDALAGDAKARDWLAKWLLGLESRLLTVLAAEESGAEPAEAAECEISARRKTIEYESRRTEYLRHLNPCVGPKGANQHHNPGFSRPIPPEFFRRDHLELGAS